MKHSLPIGHRERKPPCVAVIERRPEVQNGIAYVLGLRGCEVVIHDRTEGALAFVRRHRPNVVIVDLHLEYREAGLDTVRELRGEPDTAHIPVVVWSSDLEVGRKVADAGLKGVAAISKFGHASVLLATLEQLTASSGGGDAGHDRLDQA